jgi:hypothetical protein
VNGRYCPGKTLTPTRGSVTPCMLRPLAAGPLGARPKRSALDARGTAPPPTSSRQRKPRFLAHLVTAASGAATGRMRCIEFSIEPSRPATAELLPIPSNKWCDTRCFGCLGTYLAERMTCALSFTRADGSLLVVVGELTRPNVTLGCAESSQVTGATLTPGRLRAEVGSRAAYIGTNRVDPVTLTTRLDPEVERALAAITAEDDEEEKQRVFKLVVFAMGENVVGRALPVHIARVLQDTRRKATEPLRVPPAQSAFDSARGDLWRFDDVCFRAHGCRVVEDAVTGNGGSMPLVGRLSASSRLYPGPVDDGARTAEAFPPIPLAQWVTALHAEYGSCVVSVDVESTNRVLYRFHAALAA